MISPRLPDGYTDVPAGKIAAVVTSLDMHERPALRPETPDAPWSLRRMEHPDLGWYRDLYRCVGQNWLWFSRLEMSDRALAATIGHSAVEVYSLAADGADEGLLELDFRHEDTCELAFFGLITPLLGKGAGRWLMNRAIERAWSQPIRRFWVHTCTLDHPAALAFYMRSGFHPFRRQIEVADDPRLLGTTPRTVAPHIPLIEVPPSN